MASPAADAGSGGDIAGVQADPAALLRQTMRNAAATVCVSSLYTGDGEERAGLTVSSMTSVCLEPPVISVCINREASVAPFLAIGRLWSLFVLAEPQSEIATAFASEPDRGTRFSKGAWGRRALSGIGGVLAGSPHTVPWLSDAMAGLALKIRAVEPCGTHYVVLSDVVDGEIDPTRAPLLYSRGTYGRLAAHPDG